MNREIKYKLWDTEKKLMLNCYEIVFVQGGIRASDGCTTQGWVKVNKGFEHLKSTLILREYTGLKDLNDKEIYEGDILTSEEYPFQDEGNSNYNAEVYWDEGALQYCIQLHCVNPNKAGISDGVCEGLTEDNIQFEVIGNIYENPELLEASNG